jgi:hypothetical protein
MEPPRPCGIWVARDELLAPTRHRRARPLSAARRRRWTGQGVSCRFRCAHMRTFAEPRLQSSVADNILLDWPPDKRIYYLPTPINSQQFQSISNACCSRVASTGAPAPASRCQKCPRNDGFLGGKRRRRRTNIFRRSEWMVGGNSPYELKQYIPMLGILGLRRRAEANLRLIFIHFCVQGFDMRTLARECMASGRGSIETRRGIAARKFPAKGQSIEGRCGRHAERGTCTYPVAAYGLNGVRRRSNCTSRRSCKGPRENTLFLRPHVSGRHHSCRM